MKKLFLTLALLCATITTLVAQEIAPSKNKFGALLSTNIFGFDEGFNKVELYLMRSQDTDISQNIWSSVSQIDNLQHIFIKIPVTGKYKLRVVFKSPQANIVSQRYGLAWWAKYQDR